MSLTFTTFFDGQFWIGVLETTDAVGTRAVKVTFGPEPSDAELHAWLLAHGNDLIDRLHRATPTPTGSRPDIHTGNPKRAQRKAARQARAPRPSTASQLALKADQEERGRQQASQQRTDKDEQAEQRRALRRAKAKAKHRGH